MKRRRLVVVTGAPASGKTEALALAAEELARKGAAARVCLSVATARVEEGLSLGFDLVCLKLAGGRAFEAGRVELARRAPPEPGAAPIRERLRPFEFSEDAIAAAAAFLLEEGTARELTIIDEVGPLELRAEGGFRPVLDAWAAGELAGDLAVSVRPALAGDLAGLLGVQEPLAVSLDGAAAADAARTIVAGLTKAR